MRGKLRVRAVYYPKNENLGQFHEAQGMFFFRRSREPLLSIDGKGKVPTGRAR